MFLKWVVFSKSTDQYFKGVKSSQPFYFGGALHVLVSRNSTLFTPEGCGATHQESSGTISFNASGGITRQCQWRITAAYGEKINLNITSLTIMDTPDVCSNNFLEIRDGHFKKSPLIGEIKN